MEYAHVFPAIVALALASATSTAAQSSATLNSNASWWERVTVTVTGDGKAQSCRYETSLEPKKAQQCDVAGSEAALAAGSSGSSSSKSEYTRITFERRFSPAGKPETKLQPGDTFLGGQVMALAIDAQGAVKDCQVIAKSGSLMPAYGCDEAAAERFEASARDKAATAAGREGYMTILVYGHSEHLV